MEENPSITRRDFLGTAAVAGAAAALGELNAAPAGGIAPAAGAEEAAAPWWERPMRWAQLTLVEDDPGKFDPAFWIDYFKRTHSDAACLSAGGCVAFYPTKLPLHHRSAWLGDSDPFGELVKGCRGLGMVVVARTDPHAVHQDVHDAHPDWIAVDASGSRRRHWASPEMWVTCGLGPYHFEFMTEVKKEIVSLYKVDGIFVNRWDGSGMCYCEHCQQNFKEASGLDLPRTADPRDPARRAYMRWREDRLLALWGRWDAAVRAVRPDARVIPNTGGGALSSFDMKRIAEWAPTLAADRQARRGLMPPWASGKNGKEFRAAMGRKPIIGIFSVGLEEPYRWKDSVQTEAEIRIWVADAVAGGLRPWFTKFSGTIHDPRWLRIVEDLYACLHRMERYLRNEAPIARVAVVFSQQTGAFYGGERAREKVEDPILGVYQALIEARIPFEMVHDRLLEPDRLAPFKTLVLPNIAALSDEQCARIRGFAARGGSIVATHETSLHDEWGERRRDFGLRDLLGVSFKGRIEGPMRNSYLRLERDAAGKAHPILAGLEDAPRIINGVWRVEVEATEEFTDPPLTLIPSYPDLPMEKVYPRQPRTAIPGVHLRAVGPSRIAYFPWDIDRAFWEVMCADHGKLLGNAVAWATGEEPPVSAAGPGVLDIAAWRQAGSMTVHLVNLTNPMMMKGPFRELIPVGEQRVTVRLPAGKRAARVQLLVSGAAPRVEEEAGTLRVSVPSILDHEVVAIDLED